VITADYEDGKDELIFAVSKSGEAQNLASDERPADKPEAPDTDSKK
jgi:ATP-dependent Clp protease ATP-binding subunit ClpC